MDRICGVLRDRDPRPAPAGAGERGAGASAASWFGSDGVTAHMAPSPATPSGSPTVTALGGTHAPPGRARRHGAALAALGAALAAVASIAVTSFGVGSFAWRPADHPAGSTTSAADAAPLGIPSPSVDEALASTATATATAEIAPPDAGPLPVTTSDAPPRRNQTLGVSATPTPKRAPARSDPFKRDVF